MKNLKLIVFLFVVSLCYFYRESFIFLVQYKMMPESLIKIPENFYCFLTGRETHIYATKEIQNLMNSLCSSVHVALILFYILLTHWLMLGRRNLNYKYLKMVNVVKHLLKTFVKSCRLESEGNLLMNFVHSLVWILYFPLFLALYCYVLCFVSLPIIIVRIVICFKTVPKTFRTAP